MTDSNNAYWIVHDGQFGLADGDRRLFVVCAKNGTIAFKAARSAPGGRPEQLAFVRRMHPEVERQMEAFGIQFVVDAYADVLADVPSPMGYA